MKYLSILLIGLLVFTGCRDDEFDGPPTDFTNPDLEVNSTIAELKAGNIIGEFDEITDDVIISGIVTADDESGNFFREVIIQDESGAISLALDANDVYNIYPVGRRLFVKLQGLWIGDNRGAQQIGAGAIVSGNFTNVERIPEALINQHIFAGAVEGQPEPIVKSLSQLTTADFNSLIRLKEVEIAPNLVGLPYANAGGGSGVNQTVVDCQGNSVIMRNSDFADFAAELMPSGNGDIICIYSVFGSDPQLKIRSTADMILGNASCNMSSDCSDVTIAAFRSCYTGTETPAPAGELVGTVISDRAAKNINSQNLVLQDGNRGIVIRFTEEHSFNLGDALSINTAGGLIGDFNGLLQVSELGTGAASVTSTGNMITPNIVSVENILSNGDNLESTLVQINDVSLSGSTWGDGVDVSDNSGSINVFTFFSSTFADDVVPGTAESLVAIVSRFNDVQLNLRNASDINGGGINPPGGDPVEVSIQSIRDLWSGAGSIATVGADQKISGVVISDFANGNITGRNLVVQNGTEGIVVRFNEDHSFAVGDNIEVVISGQEVSDFNGLVQLNNIPNANASVSTASEVISPLEIGIDAVLASPSVYESTLVKFNGVTISGASTFNGSTTVSDGSNDIPMFTRGDATFSDDAVPGGSVNLTGIIGNFNGVQINMRSGADVE